MTLALRFAARSDIGLRRQGNEDSAYAGPHLLAVADGMGGHAAGEVASAAVITTIAALDTDHAVDDLPGTVSVAVASASQRLRELILADAAREGMGTTLTAMVWTDDGHVAIGHVGDSRAYLLRDGQMYQVTRDHTKVQALLEQGKITEAELETHPERSVLLRALDGRHAVKPDVSVHEAVTGDRYLLCSDGLSGVAPERAVFQTLCTVRDPDVAARRLIELACKGGGPDNITCIVADVIDPAAGGEQPTLTSTFAGAAADGPSGEPAISRPDDPQDPDLTGALPQHLVVTRPQQALHDEDIPRARPRGNPETKQPDDAALLRQRVDDLEAARARQDEKFAELGDTIAGLDETIAGLEEKIADLADEAAATRTQTREQESARKDSARDMAFAAQARELRKLRTDFISLRDDVDTGGTPSPGIASRRRESADTAAVKDWQVPPELADVLNRAEVSAMTSYVPRLAGYSGIGAGLLALTSPGTAVQPERDETEGDTSDQPQG